MELNIENLTLKQIREIAAVANGLSGNCDQPTAGIRDNGMIGKYVVVRCRDAGVHAGVLRAHSGRECILTESRRLWYFKPAAEKWLSGVVKFGLSSDSRVGEPQERIHLTEVCEISICSPTGEGSIRGMKNG